MSTSAFFSIEDIDKPGKHWFERESKPLSMNDSLKIWFDTAKEFEEDGHEDFRANFVICSMRFLGVEKIGEQWKSFVKIFKDFKEDRPRIIGFDVIQEENIATDPRMNQSIPLPDLQAGLDAANAEAEKVFGKDYKDIFRPIFHSGETSDIPPGKFEKNMEFAFKNDSKRFGHGIGIIKSNNDAIRNAVADSGKVMEVCPISNMLLGYYKDISQHPFEDMTKARMKVTFNPDDPGLWRYWGVTPDY